MLVLEVKEQLRLQSVQKQVKRIKVSMQFQLVIMLVNLHKELMQLELVRNKLVRRIKAKMQLHWDFKQVKPIKELMLLQLGI